MSKRVYMGTERPKRWTWLWIREEWQGTCDFERLAELRKRTGVENRDVEYLMAVADGYRFVAGVILVTALGLWFAAIYNVQQLFSGDTVLGWGIYYAVLVAWLYSVCVSTWWAINSLIAIERHSHFLVEVAIPGHWCYRKKSTLRGGR